MADLARLAGLTLKALRGVTKTGTTWCAKQCNLVL